LARNVVGTLRAVKVVWRRTFESDRPFEREFAGIQKFEPISRSNEGLVDILQIGREEGAGYFYYVMELADDAGLPGEGNASVSGGGAPRGLGHPNTYEPLTLRAEIKRRGRLPIEECLRHFLTLASGLAALHEKGLIHRDIKPSNIILVRGVAKLADIGLVTEAGESLSFVGTEGFIAPEGPRSRQADIYSLGKVLYEAVTGNDRLQFPSLPPSVVTGRVEEDLLEVNAVLLRACASDPRERYASVEEVRADLSLLLSGRSVKRLRLLDKRLRWARQAGAVTGVIALLAVAGGLTAGYRAKVARENSARLERALERAHRAEAMAEDRLYQSLAATAVAELRGGTADARFASLAAIASAAGIHPGSPELRDAAISALALPGLRELRRWPLAPGFTVQCFSGDLQQILLADTQGVIHVRRASDGEELFTFGEPGDEVTNLGALSADGRWISLIRQNAKTERWDLAQRRRVSRVPVALDGAISANGRWLVELGAEGKVFWRDLAVDSARELKLKRDYDLLSGGPGTDFVLASRAHTNVCLVDFATGQPRFEFALPNLEPAYSLQLSPDGGTLLVNLASGRVLVYNLRASETPRAILEPHTGAVRYGRFHPDGDWCLTSSWDNTTRLIGVTEGRVISLWRRGSQQPAFSRDGSRVGWRDADNGELCLFEAAGRAACRILGEPPSPQGGSAGPWNSVFLSDGRLLATASYDGVGLYETHRGQEVARLLSTNCFAVTFAGTNQLYAAGPNGLVRWSLAWNGPAEATLAEPQTLTTNFLWHVCSSDDGRVVATTGLREFTLLFADGRTLRVPHQSGIRGAFLSHDGRRLAAVHPAADLRVWNTEDGTLLGRFPGQVNAGGGAFDPSGQRVVLNDIDSIVVWDLESRRECWRLPVAGNASAAAWSPNGRLVAATRDGVVCLLLDAETGTVMGRLQHPDPRLYAALVFSPDSAQLACSSTAHVVHLWDFRGLRRELAAVHLDWDQPPLPPVSAPVPAPRLCLTPSAPPAAPPPSSAAR